MSYLTVQIIKIWHCFSRFSQINPVTSLVLCTNPGHSHDHAVKSHVWYHRNMSSNGIILDITMIVIKYNSAQDSKMHPVYTPIPHNVW